MKFSNTPVCPGDGEKLTLKIDATGGVNTWTTGDFHATCPQCGRRWVQRMVIEWEEVPSDGKATS